ncbi:hypothetical protein FACS189413_17940 [Bacteroidia bacterium]|nr:hypothetical protein FACS189413_17940 [Bacteroidia bacterium]
MKKIIATNTNAIGQKIQTIEQIATGQTRLDLNHLQKGIYVLKVNETSVRFIKK